MGDFEGFKPRQKLEQYTGIPNEVFDEVMSRVSGNQFKVLMAIFRKTYGWVDGSDGKGNATYKIEDEIAQSQLMEMTGLSRNTVKSNLGKLIEKGLIIKVKDYKKGVNKAAKYRIKQNRGSKFDTRNKERGSKFDTRNGKRGSKLDTRRGSKFDSTKESNKEKVSSKERAATEVNKDLEQLKAYICGKVGRTSLIGEETLSQKLEEHSPDIIKKATNLAVKRQKEREGFVNINSYKYILRFVDEVKQQKENVIQFKDVL